MIDTAVDLEMRDGACTKEGCAANLGGACAERHDDKIDCEFYELTEIDKPTPAEISVRRIALPDGEALRPDEIERALRSHPVSIVVPLGRVKAGKTTLIAVSYHLLRSHRLRRWQFAGSETIIGLARRAHDASFASERQEPITPRTEKEESGLHLHLGMRCSDDDARYPIVLVDISGEHVNELANGERIEVIAKALSRADHVPVVIDGRQIADPSARSLAVLEARALLKMLEKYEFPTFVEVCLVITKGDLLVGHNLTETVQSIVNGTLAEGAPYFVTADRPSYERDEGGEPVVMLGDGIDAFIDHIAKRHATTTSERADAGCPRPSPVLGHMWARP